jgi:hypothetical protein
MGRISKMPRAEQWADRICIQLGKSVEAVIEVGRLLNEAQKDLPEGEWCRFFDNGLVPFSRQWAAKYMAIARNQVISNVKDPLRLPAAVETLYALAKADQATLKNALRDGVITPDMPRKAVAALMPSRATARVVTPKQVDSIEASLTAIQDRLSELWDRHPREHATIQAAISSWETYFAMKREAV